MPGETKRTKPTKRTRRKKSDAVAPPAAVEVAAAPDGTVVEVGGEFTGDAVDRAADPGEDQSPPSLARQKAHLLAELRDAETGPVRAAEIRELIDGPLADVPILSYAERQRLGQ